MRYLVPTILMMACAPSEDKLKQKRLRLPVRKPLSVLQKKTLLQHKIWGLAFGFRCRRVCRILTEASEEETDDTASTDLVYNKEYAKDCLAAMEEMSCDDFSSGLPSACEDVYTEE